jgi:O-methyltransferase
MVKRLLFRLLFSIPQRLQFSRNSAFIRVFNFVYFNKIEGNFIEFGVGSGTTLKLAIANARARKMTRMVFFGIDTFQGFPETQGPEIAFETYSSIVGSRSFTRKEILKTLRIRDDRDLHLVKCNMESDDLSSLTVKMQELKISIVHLDMDFYMPTLNALNMIFTSLSVGSVLMFDNYFFFAANDDMGERRAFREFQLLHPEVVISNYFNYGWHGMAFVVSKVPGASVTN